MKAGRLSYALIALAMIGGMLLLLMWRPVQVGPYSATHGPVTALRAIRAAVLIAWSLTIAARMLCAAGKSVSTPVRSVIVTEIPRANDSWFLVLSILRC
jgi:hypothetical protein